MTEAPKTILVVEDEDDVREIIRLILEGAGYRVIETGRPESALDLARQQRPDLVICDIAMPGMDGYAVLRSLQADATAVLIPVVFLSAHRDFSERMRAFRAGVVDYITKPFSRDTLQKRVERIFDGLARRGSLLPEADGAEELGEAEAEPEDAGDGGLDALADNPAELSSGGGMPSFEGFPEVLRDVLIVDDHAAFRDFLPGVPPPASPCTRPRRGRGPGDGLDRRPGASTSACRGRWFEFCRRCEPQPHSSDTALVPLRPDDYAALPGPEMGADDFLSKQTRCARVADSHPTADEEVRGPENPGAKGSGIEGWP